MVTMGSMNLWMSDSFNPGLVVKTFGSRFVEFMSFDGANTVASTYFVYCMDCLTVQCL